MTTFSPRRGRGRVMVLSRRGPSSGLKPIPGRGSFSVIYSRRTITTRHGCRLTLLPVWERSGGRGGLRDGATSFRDGVGLILVCDNGGVPNHCQGRSPYGLAPAATVIPAILLCGGAASGSNGLTVLAVSSTVIAVG